MYNKYWLQINNKGFIGPYENINRAYKAYRQLIKTTLVYAAKVYSGYLQPEVFEHVIV